MGDGTLRLRIMHHVTANPFSLRYPDISRLAFFDSDTQKDGHSCIVKIRHEAGNEALQKWANSSTRLPS